jgi:hypothetical protein
VRALLLLDELRTADRQLVLSQGHLANERLVTAERAAAAISSRAAALAAAQPSGVIQPSSLRSTPRNLSPPRLAPASAAAAAARCQATAASAAAQMAASEAASAAAAAEAAEADAADVEAAEEMAATGRLNFGQTPATRHAATPRTQLGAAALLAVATGASPLGRSPLTSPVYGSHRPSSREGTTSVAPFSVFRGAAPSVPDAGDETPAAATAPLSERNSLLSLEGRSWTPADSYTARLQMLRAKYNATG